MTKGTKGTKGKHAPFPPGYFDREEYQNAIDEIEAFRLHDEMILELDVARREEQKRVLYETEGEFECGCGRKYRMIVKFEQVVECAGRR